MVEGKERRLVWEGRKALIYNCEGHSIMCAPSEPLSLRDIVAKIDNWSQFSAAPLESKMSQDFGMYTNMSRKEVKRVQKKRAEKRFES